MTGVLAYLLPHWRHLQLLFSLPLVVLVAAYWLELQMIHLF